MAEVTFVSELELCFTDKLQGNDLKCHSDVSVCWSDDDTSCYVTETSEAISLADSDTDEADDESSVGISSQQEPSQKDDRLFLVLGGKRRFPRIYDGLCGGKRVVELDDKHNNPTTTESNLSEETIQQTFVFNALENNNSYVLDRPGDIIGDTKGQCLLNTAVRTKHEFEEWNIVKCTEMRASPVRWLVLTIMCLSIFVRSFVSVVFGQINDVFAAYYNVPSGAVDWLTNAGSVATLIVVPLVAYIGRYKMGLRDLCLLMTATASLGTVLLTGAMMDRKHGFILAITGQTVMGVNNAIAMTIPPLVAATWFPENEVATAFASALISVGAGDAIGSYLPALLVAEPPTPYDDNPGFENINVSVEMQFRLVLMFACTAGLSVITFAVAAAVLRERPDFPPSRAQQIRRDKTQHSDKQLSSTPLYRNKDFIQVTVFYGISAASAANSVTLLSSMIGDAFVDVDVITNVDLTSGRIMTVMFICFSIGPFVAGRIIDKTRCYLATTLAGMTGLALGNAGVVVSLLTQSLTGLYASHILVGFFMGISETALFEIASEVTYPLPEINFSCILVMSWMVFFVSYPILGRLALTAIESSAQPRLVTASAASVPTAFSVASLLLAIVYLRPTYKRRVVSTQIENTKEALSETTSLLHH